jgi:hypothetical protein
MGTEHLAAVWETSRQTGSNLVVLLAIASYSDQQGEWVVDQATLQRRARIGRRRVQQILDELVKSGELSVVSHHGRGKISTYQLLIGPENAQPTAPLPAGKGERCAAFSAPKGESECAFSAEKGEASCTFAPGKGETACPFSAPPSPPFPPDPQIPPYPPEAEKETDLESFALAPRPLTGPQSATFRTNLLLEEAGVPLPSPAQIGFWVQKLGAIEPLLDLLRRLIPAGLANKKNPAAYIHRVVLERATRPEPLARPFDARAGRELLRAAGADETRWQQALEIIAATEGEP